MNKLTIKIITKEKSLVFKHILFVSLSSNYPKNTRSLERVFFYPCRQAWHIITRQRVYHQERIAVVVSHHTFRCAFLSAWWYTKLKFWWYAIPAELMIYNGMPLILLVICSIINTEEVRLCPRIICLYIPNN